MSSSENPRPGTFFPAFFLIRRFARTIEAKIQWIVESEESRAHLFPVSYFVVESENEPPKKENKESSGEQRDRRLRVSAWIC